MRLSRRFRKQIGAYYTPDALSEILSRWAIRTRTDVVLEPSFGGCGFLKAARDQLVRLGSSSPEGQIFGCDIDPNAFTILERLFPQRSFPDNFLNRSFLTIRPGIDLPSGFQATIGNPPYLTYQRVASEDRLGVLAHWRALGVEISGKASLWALFVIHAINFLAPGGRAAWVLPGAFLQADYAKAIKRLVSTHFERVLVVTVRERLFKNEGTNEETVILLADGFHPETVVSLYRSIIALDIPDLSRILSAWPLNDTGVGATGAKPILEASEGSGIAVFETFKTNHGTKPLGDYLRTQIGLVTGDNDFFLLTEKDRASWKIDQCVPVLARMRSAPGLSYSRDDHEALLLAGERGYLFHSETDPSENQNLQAYLQRMPAEKRPLVRTFKKRRHWYAPDDKNVPEAFFSSMTHHGPKLVINKAGHPCVNSIHRVFFHSGVSERERMLLSISLLTTFGQLSSEFSGRKYGSGVLKHEPRDVEKIEVSMPSNLSMETIVAAFRDIDSLLRLGKHDLAYSCADEAVFGKVVAQSSEMESLRELLNTTRAYRRAAIERQ